MSVSERAGFDCLDFQDLAGGEGVSAHNRVRCPLTFEFIPTGLFGLDFKLAGTTAIKESTTEMREVHVCWQHGKRKIIKFELLFILVMMNWSLILVL